MLRLLAVAVVALAVVLAWSGTAFGATGWFSRPFAVGQAVGPSPVGLAVNTSTSASDPTAGDVYISGGTVVNRYTAASAAAGNVTPDGQLTGFGYAYGIAVDPTTGDVYGADVTQTGVVRKFDNTGAPVPFALDPLIAPLIWNPGGIAVNPANSHVFVGDLSNPTIYEFDSSGAYTGNSYVAPSGPSGLAIDASAQATLDGSADVYAATGGNGVVRFTAPGAPYEIFTMANGGGVAVAPSTQHVYVTGGGSAAEYDTNGVQVGPTLGTGLLADSYGIGIDADGSHLYVADNPANSAFAFTNGIVPDPTTGDASDIESTTVTLNGHVDPDGGPEATCSFSYGIDPALAGADTVSCVGGPNAAPADVTAQVSGLRPAQTYYYRLNASNSLGSTSGEIKSLTTPSAAPAAVTGQAVNVTTSHATLRGTLNPYGLQTSYHFDYGPTASYGSRVPAGSDSVAGNGHDEQELARGISGLQPGTTYHYQLVATNSLGTTNGDDHRFITDAADPPARGYEMVSPLDNGDINVDVTTYDGVKARADGNAVVYTNKGTYPGSASNPAAVRVLGMRQGDGWSNMSLDAPTTGSGVLIAHTVVATSEDLLRTLVISSRKLGEQGVEGNGNLYIYDVPTKHYTLVATSSDPRFFSEQTGNRAPYLYVGGASDLSTVAFVSPAALTPDTVGFDKLYVWSETAGLRFVSANQGPTIDYATPQANQVSADGARVYVSSEGGGVSLYEGGQLTPISVVQRTGEPQARVAGRFWGASPDGRYALLTSPELLTDDAVRVMPNDTLLYRYDASTGQLEFLAGGLSDAGNGYAGVMSGPGTDGDVYFKSYITQAGVEGPLSVYHAGPAGVEFVATLANPTESGAADVSPSGRYLVFESAARLTAYDNGGWAQIYLYDARTKELVCPSCRTDGSHSTGLAKIGQPGPGRGSAFQRYFAQSVTDDGQVFFDTPDSLVTADVNGVRDVYAYQHGRVDLISRGIAGRDARFLDATPSGSDVFFATEDQLVGQDRNPTIDLYDARIGGGIPAQSPNDRAACGGSECREPDSGSSGSPPTASERVDAPVGKSDRARARVSVARSSFTSSVLRLTVSVSGRGRIRVVGAAVKTTVRTVSRAGRYTLKIPLTTKTRMARRAGRRVRVAVRVTLAPPFAGLTATKLTRTLGR